MKNSHWLFLIIILASVLRLVSLDKVPPELFGDEVDVGYHSYSLLKTGKDYLGQALPFYIHSFSEWRAPLLMYATIPSVAIFGLNEWGVRLPNAVFGLLSITLLYYLVKTSLKNEKVAICSSFLLAISPWHIQYSRAAFEASLLLALLLTGVVLFLKGLENNRFFILSAIPFSLSFYTYSTAIVFTPLLILLLVFTHKKELTKLPKNKFINPVILFLLLSLPIAYHVLFGFATERYQKFSVFSDEAIISNINQKRADGGKVASERMFHNKALDWGRKIISNYSIAFSPQFLFIDGDVTFRHSIHEIGELFWIQLPLLIAGLLLISKQKDKNHLFWVGWLLIAPIPMALTKDGAYHATRLILMLPALTVITALGFKHFLEISTSKKLKILTPLVVIILIAEFALYQHRFWVHYPKESWRWWHTGYEEAILFMKKQEPSYDIITLNNTYEPALIRFLFWWNYPPEKFQKEFKTDKEQENILSGFNGFKLGDKYYFGIVNKEKGGIPAFVKTDTIYLVSQRDEIPGDWDWEKSPPAGIRVLKAVRNPYGEPIFYVVTGELPR